MDHTCIPLIFQVILIGQRYSFGGKTRLFFCASLASIAIICKCKGSFMPTFSLEIAHLPCFKILHINPNLISELIHENSTTNIEWNALYNFFTRLGSLKARDAYWEPLLNSPYSGELRWHAIWEVVATSNCIQLPTSLKTSLSTHQTRPKPLYSGSNRKWEHLFWSVPHSHQHLRLSFSLWEHVLILTF